MKKIQDLLDMILEQVEICSEEDEQPITSILQRCYEDLVDLEMER